MNYFILSYYFSVLVQFLSLIFQGYAYNLNVPKDILPLKYALNIEFLVSIVEIIIYIWIGTNLVNFKSVMLKRYIDWFITTNFLLVSIAIVLEYYETKEQHLDYDVNNVIIKNIPKYIPILIFNNLMLIIGYLGEIKKIDKKYSFTFGFLFFILSFYYLYKYFIKTSLFGKRFFYVITTIWALYGVSHILSEKIKNTMYNLLDLFSKNFFGIFLAFLILDLI